MMNPDDTSDRERDPVVQWPAILSVAAAVVLLTLVPATGQWLKYPTPGIPRLPDGKPDLAAPTPRTADGKVGSFRAMAAERRWLSAQRDGRLVAERVSALGSRAHEAACRALWQGKPSRAVPTAWSGHAEP